VAKELETLHAAAAEQLEGLYEARLALEGERLAQLAAAKDDVELRLKVGGDVDCKCYGAREEGRRVRCSAVQQQHVPA
jgi:hypothetical protein